MKRSKIRLKNKTLKNKIILLFSSLLILSFAALTFITVSFIKHEVRNDSLNMMSELTQGSASDMKEYVNKYIMLAETLASSVDMSSDVEVSSNFDFLEKYIQQYNLDRILITDTTGQGINSDGQTVNIAERDYFKTAVTGKATVSSPLADKTSNKTVMVYAAPIMNNGSIKGVLAFARDGKELSDKVAEITFRKTGKTCLIDSTGNTIGHYDYERVQNGENIIAAAESKPELKELANIISKMKDGKSGADEYMFNGTKRVISYVNIPDFNWSIGLMVDSSDLFGVVSTVLKLIFIVCIVTLIIASFAVYRFSISITNRLSIVTNTIEKFSQGDFTQNISEEDLKHEDEIGIMLNSLKTAQGSLKEMILSIKDSSSILEHESSNLTNLSEEYLSSCNNIIIATKESAEGTTSQATQIIGISNSMEVFDVNLNSIISAISNISSTLNNINEKSTMSNKDIAELVNTIKELEINFNNFSETVATMKNSINDITTITEVINSLSEQTNLLALNAAIEAARAGETGRGFAIVAEEIRKLAEESKSSSAKISSIVKNVLQESNLIVDGSNVINSSLQNQISETSKTMNSFDEIISLVYEVTNEINNLNDNSNKILSEKGIIADNIDNSSAISEELSAATEEIYASSTTLSSSSSEIATAAENLHSLTENMLNNVNKFKID